MGGPTARFFKRIGSDILSSAPLLIAAVDERVFDSAAFSPYDTAVAVKSMKRTEDKPIVQMLPYATNIAVVIGDWPGKILAGRIQALVQAFPKPRDLRIVQRTVAGRDDQACRGTASALCNLLCDGESRSESGSARGRRGSFAFAQNGNRPYLSLHRQPLREWHCRRPMISISKLQAKAQCRHANLEQGEPQQHQDANAGIKCADIEWQQLKRSRNKQVSFADGERIQFRPPSAWEQYHWQILLIAAALVVQSL